MLSPIQAAEPENEDRASWVQEIIARGGPKADFSKPTVLLLQLEIQAGRGAEPGKVE